VIIHLSSTEQAKTSIRHNWEKITTALDSGKHLTMEIMLTAAQMKADIWRSEQASERLGVKTTE